MAGVLLGAHKGLWGSTGVYSSEFATVGSKYLKQGSWHRGVHVKRTSVVENSGGESKWDVTWGRPDKCYLAIYNKLQAYTITVL